MVPARYRVMRVKLQMYARGGRVTVTKVCVPSARPMRGTMGMVDRLMRGRAGYGRSGDRDMRGQPL